MQHYTGSITDQPGLTKPEIAQCVYTDIVSCFVYEMHLGRNNKTLMIRATFQLGRIVTHSQLPDVCVHRNSFMLV